MPSSIYRSPVGRDIFLGKVCCSMEYFRFGNNKDMIFLRERMSNFVSCLYIHYVVMFCCMYVVVSGMLDSTPYFSYYLDDKLTFFCFVLGRSAEQLSPCSHGIITRNYMSFKGHRLPVL